MSDAVVVWGNCQAAPLAELLRTPLARQGLRVVDVPPVYLADAAAVARVHAVMRSCAVLVSQPVADEYRVPGCGTDQLAALLPAGARVVRLPVVYDVGAFPFQVHGYAGDGARIDAPITDYHDLRVLQAAAERRSVAATLEGWGGPPAAAVHAVAGASLAELRRREAGLDVRAADLVRTPGALWTMTHPSNRVLAAVAERVLAELGVPGPVAAPAREFLGQRRAAVDATTAAALGWPDDRARWVVDGRAVGLPNLLERQLAFYAGRPDVVRASLARAAERLRLLDVGRPATAAGGQVVAMATRPATPRA